MPEILAAKSNVANLSVSRKHLYKALICYSVYGGSTSFSCVIFDMHNIDYGSAYNSCWSMKRA